MLILINIDHVNIESIKIDQPRTKPQSGLMGYVSGPTSFSAQDGSEIVLKAPPGLKNLEVSETRVGTVRGDLGYYHYRGHNAADLAQCRSFEHVVALLHDLGIDDAAESDLRDRLGRARASISPDQVESWHRMLVGEADNAERAVQPPVTPLIVALLATVDSRPTTDMTAAERQQACLRAVGIAPTVLAGSWRVANGQRPLVADPKAGHAFDYVRMVTGTQPTEEAARAVELYLNLTAEHGFNASTFTGRVITSTGASVPSALGGAVGALLGPLHGGAPSRVLDMINAIGDPVNAEAWAQRELDAGRKLMGFGHAVYRVTDPRSDVLKEMARSLPGDEAIELLARAEEIEHRIHAVLQRHRPNGRFITNVEYYAAVVLALAGIPQEMFTATFVVSRLVGWTAHILEQADNNKIMRPSARYVGPIHDAPELAGAST